MDRFRHALDCPFNMLIWLSEKSAGGKPIIPTRLRELRESGYGTLLLTGTLKMISMAPIENQFQWVPLKIIAELKHN